MNLTAQSLKDDFLGRACSTTVGEHCLLNQRLARITPLQGLHSGYLLQLLKSSVFRQFVRGLNTGSLIQHMFTSQLDEFAFPLPPHDEQDEIIAIMDSCLSTVDTTHEQIVPELKRAARLRQSILKRAFEGKLVPQDPADEPAAALLERIRANGHIEADDPRRGIEKRKLVK